MLLKKWYVLHVYSQHEDKVKQSIEDIAKNNGLSDYIGEIYLPKKIEKKIDQNGKEREINKVVYSGWLYVNLKLTDEIWHLIMGIDGVTNFVGNNKPIPLRPGQMKQIKSGFEDKPSVVVSAYKPGDLVIVKKEPFTDTEAKVVEIRDSKVVVSINFFNKETNFEYDFSDVEPA